MDHGARRAPEPGFTDMVTLFFMGHGLEDELPNRLMAGGLAQQGRQIPFTQREKASADFAVGGQAYAAAMAAKGPCDRRDDADFARGPIDETVPFGRLAGRMGDLYQREQAV